MRRAAGRGGPHKQGVGAPPSGTQRASSARYLLTSHRHPRPTSPPPGAWGGPGQGWWPQPQLCPPFTLTYLYGGTQEWGWEGRAQLAPPLLKGLSRPSEEGPLWPKGRGQAEGVTRGHGHGHGWQV